MFGLRRIEIYWPVNQNVKPGPITAQASEQNFKNFTLGRIIFGESSLFFNRWPLSKGSRITKKVLLAK